MPNQAPNNRIFTRAAISFLPSTLREDDRSVEFVLTTEAPARVFDYERWAIVDEVLMMRGVAFPKGGKMPLLDSHTRESTANIKGSVRDMRVEGDKIIGRLYFAHDAEDDFVKVRDGHIDSGSIGYEVMQARYVEDGEETEYNGKRYAGPVKLSLKWRLMEYSLVAIGADENAKVRNNSGTYSREADINTEENTMPSNNVPNTPDTTAEESRLKVQEMERKAAEAETRAKAAEARAAKIENDAAIDQLCARHNMTDVAADLKAQNISAERAAVILLEKLTERNKPVTGATVPTITGGEDESEKFQRAATDAMLIRAHGAAKVKNPDAGAAQMERISLLTLAQECVRRAGGNPAFMSREDVYKMALRSSSSIPTLGIGNFASILANVATKSMMMGWNYAPSTYERWCKIGTLSDFKAAKRVQVSSAPDLLVTPEFAEVKHGVMSDTGEDIQLATMARKLVISRQALINDDMNVFNDMFTMFGARARAVVNRLPYALLAANAAMADTEDLFSSAHGNDANTAFSTTSAAAAYAAMFQQKSKAPGDGVDEGIPLNIVPAYLLVGYANMVEADIMTGSFASVESDENSGVKNPYNRLQLIPDANITTNVGKQHYYVADPNQCPTVEVAFLDGNRSPILTQEPTSSILGIDFTAVLDATAKALDYRGLYRNEGG